MSGAEAGLVAVAGATGALIASLLQGRGGPPRGHRGPAGPAPAVRTAAGPYSAVPPVPGVPASTATYRQ